MWVSTHAKLYGDARLGSEVQRRFLPTRFDPGGNAVDSQGSTCSEVACPKCHLVIPRTMFEMPSLFYSILGSPGSGKSHLLATTTWQLRQALGRRFKLSLTDADPESNRLLNESEARLFFNEEPNKLTAIGKTETEGALYQPVQFGEETIWYPRPFVFSLQPLLNHPNKDDQDLAKAMCLYDNAGEHFLPGGESSISPATQHLTISRGLLFLFDPTQHARFREACVDSDDPQMSTTGRSFRQDQILNEAANRIRTQAGLSQRDKYQKPLIVVMTKFDSWGPFVSDIELREPIQEVGETSALDKTLVETVSTQMRNVMSNYAPEFVNAAEGFAEHVTYIPVSALGVSPEVDESTGSLGVRPNDVAPSWAEVPLLYLLSLTSSGLIPAFTR
ncbi:MAG: hypothetical protein AB8G99_04685 [Planctomycetaceae bacterium]